MEAVAKQLANHKKCLFQLPHLRLEHIDVDAMHIAAAGVAALQVDDRVIPIGLHGDGVQYTSKDDLEK